MLHPFTQHRTAMPNFDGCFKEEVEEVTTSLRENSFCKPFVEDETVIGGPSFALDEAERRLNNPVNITVQDAMNHITAETPLLYRKMQQKRCTQFFQNRRPTPLPKVGAPRPLLLPSPSPCEVDRSPCMAQLYSLHMGAEQEKNSPVLSGIKEQKDQKKMMKDQDLAEEKSIWNPGSPKAFSFGCLTPATEGRSPVHCSPVLGFAFDSPLSPLRVEQRANDSDPTPLTSKRRTKRKRFSSLVKRRAPGSAGKFGETDTRSFKKRKLNSPIVQIMRRVTPINSPACSGIYSKSTFLSGKKLFLRTPLKCSLTPETMMTSPVELTRC